MSGGTTLRFVWNAAVFGLLSLFWSGAMIVALLTVGSDRAVRFFPRVWARSVARACGVEIEAHGLDQRLDAPAYLVMANHTSHFDVVALFGAVPLAMRSVAKRELSFIPVFGWALALGAAILIDRGDRTKAVRSIERAGRAIAAGRSVLMFPEGTRTEPGLLGPMKKGPFHLAVSAGVPILPIGVIGTGDVMPKGDWRIRSGRVVVRVGTPIPCEGLPDDDKSRAELEARVAVALRSLMGAGVDAVGFEA